MSFRDDNTKVFLKMGKGCVYFISTDYDRLKKILKVNEHFMRNLLIFNYWNNKDVGPKELLKISGEKSNEIVENDFSDEKNHISI